MNKIITIYDKQYNGKTGKKIYQKHCLGSCILEFENNTRINCVHFNYNSNNKKFYNKEDIINLNDINIVIFNYGEDSEFGRKYMKKARKLYKKINNFYPEIKIFNNPFNHRVICNKYYTYSIIKNKNYKYLKIPMFNILEKKNIRRKYFPIIVSLRIQSGGKGKYLVNNYEELKKHMNNEKDKYWSKFYDSYFPNTKIFICIRLFIFSNKLVDFIIRPSDIWNVHTGNQIPSNETINKINNYFTEYFNVNDDYIQKIINELYDLLGDGLYCHDFIFVNNKLMLCELGYKTLDPKLIKFYSENNIKSNKIASDKYKVKETYKNLLLNFNCK